MSIASRKAMAEAVKRAQAEAGFESALPSALEADPRRDELVRQFFDLVPVYRDASPTVRQLWKMTKKRKKKGWEPTDEELSIFFATVREMKRRKNRNKSIAGLIAYEEGYDLPSALDDKSFDLLD